MRAFELRRGVYSAEDLIKPRRSAEAAWARAKTGMLNECAVVHDDFPHWLGGLNLFGIENPFVWAPMLTELLPKLEPVLYEVTGWTGAKLELARLHVCDRFKYQGFWHRDAPVGAESVTAIIYLLPESGFRVIADFSDNTWSHQREEYIQQYKISANAGDVFFFQSQLPHRGHVSKRRMHMHLRFVRNWAYDVHGWNRWRQEVKPYQPIAKKQQYKELIKYLLPRKGYSSIWQHG